MFVLSPTDLLIVVGLSGILWFVIWLLFRAVFPPSKSDRLCNAFDYIADGNTPALVLAVMAGSFPNKADREFAIAQLINLVVVSSSRDYPHVVAHRKEILAAIASHVSTDDLRHVLITKCTRRLFRHGDLGAWFRKADTVDTKINAKKLICFALGMRTVTHLDTDLKASEENLLASSFQIPYNEDLLEEARNPKRSNA